MQKGDFELADRLLSQGAQDREIYRYIANVVALADVDSPHRRVDKARPLMNVRLWCSTQ
jgi:hypothetical protein